MFIKNTELIQINNLYYIPRTLLKKKLLSTSRLYNISLHNLTNNCTENKIKNRYYISYNDICKYIWRETVNTIKQRRIDTIISCFITSLKAKLSGIITNKNHNLNPVTKNTTDKTVYLKYNNQNTFILHNNNKAECIYCKKELYFKYKSNVSFDCIRCIDCYLHDTDDYQNKLCEPLNITFNSEQIYAITELYNNFFTKTTKSILLKGSAGSGKTTVISFVCGLPEFIHHRLVFSATTNKAVSVLKRTFSERFNNKQSDINFITIQKLINIRRDIDSEGNTHFKCIKRDTLNIYNYDIIVIDEASMLTSDIVNELQKIKQYMKGIIIYVGDNAQLPPVNEVDSTIFHSIKTTLNMTMVMRSKNNIVNLCNEVRKLIYNPEYKISFKKLCTNGVQINKDENTWINTYLDDYKNENYPIFLTYTNELCNSLNVIVRNRLFNNPKTKYVVNESIIFNNFYVNPYNTCISFYTSEAAIIKDFETTTLSMKHFHYRDIVINNKNKRNQDNENDNEEADINDINDINETSDMNDMNNIINNTNNIDEYDKIRVSDNNIHISEKFQELKRIINHCGEEKFKVWKLTIDTQNKDDTTIDIKKNIKNKKVKADSLIYVLHNSSIHIYKRHVEEISTYLKNLKIYVDKKYKTNEATKRWLNEYIIKPTWTFVYTQLIDLFADISYGYGITVHKSQGSGYNNVYVHVRDIISRNNNEKERTQCMYTGLSRASLQLNLLL